jgi:hypothetical protein
MMMLLPTPTRRDYKDGQAERIRFDRLQNDTLARCIFNAIRGGEILMPTPKALDGVKGNLKTSEERLDSGHQVDLPNVVIDLLPTPNTMEHREIKTPEQIAELKAKSPGGYRNLREEVINEAISWGKYEPAIRRWEALTRPAPAPTKPDGKDGAHRLSAEFTEWMMGLPEGWVTSPELGLKRNDQLKACGNGVVPQQAEMALRILLQDITI